MTIQEAWKKDSRPKRFGWAAGEYVQKCRICGDVFLGDKRALYCADCAYSQPDELPQSLTIQREAQLSDLITAIREETCQEHFYYDSGGNGCLHFKSNCPQCQIIKLMAEVEMWRLAHDTQVDAKLHQVSKCATLQAKVDRLEKENKAIKIQCQQDVQYWQDKATEARTDAATTIINLANGIDKELNTRGFVREIRATFNIKEG